MTRRGLAAAAIAVAAMAALAYYLERRDVLEGKHVAAELVFPYNTTRVAEVTVQIGDRRATLVRGPGGAWQPAPGSPEGTREDLAADLIGAWGRVRFLEVIDENPDDPGRYGLDEPRVRLAARLKEGEQPAPPRPPSFELGGPNPLQPSYYARLDGFPRVVLVTVQAAEVETLARRVLGLPDESSGNEDAGNGSPPVTSGR